jgi:hypothetical protein
LRTPEPMSMGFWNAMMNRSKSPGICGESRIRYYLCKLIVAGEFATARPLITLSSSIGRFVMIVLSEDVVKLAQSILLTWLIDASIVVGGMALVIRVVFPDVEAWIEGTKGHADA